MVESEPLHLIPVKSEPLSIMATEDEHLKQDAEDNVIDFPLAPTDAGLFDSEPTSMDDETIYRGVPRFLVVLHRLVTDPATDEMISWTTCPQTKASAFTVHKPVDLAKGVFPTIFKHTNFSRCARSLRAELNHSPGPNRKYRRNYVCTV
jgi:hypothetical protein